MTLLAPLVVLIWECFWFQCAAASGCKQTLFLVVHGRGGLVQAVFRHTKMALVVRWWMADLSLDTHLEIGPLLLCRKEMQDLERKLCLNRHSTPQIYLFLFIFCLPMKNTHKAYYTT